MRIYIESTIPSYLAARPARDLLQAARQQLTHDWWNYKRHEHDFFTSEVVLEEISFGEPEMASNRLHLLNNVPVLLANDHAQELTASILSSGVLPPAADRDAAHIALATCYNMDILLTWNCRHIANAVIQSRLRKIVETRGWQLPVLCTPEELLENANELDE